MFEQVSEVLRNDYTTEMNKFDELKNQISAYEEQFRTDKSEANYQRDIKFLNKKYNIFKRGKEYKKELEDIQKEYYEKLNQFEEDRKKYIDLKNEAAKINVYVIQKKLEQLNNAKSLEDLHMTEEDAVRVLSGESK